MPSWISSLLIYSTGCSVGLILNSILGLGLSWLDHWFIPVSISFIYPFIFIIPSVPIYDPEDLSDVAKKIWWFTFDVFSAVTPIIAILISDSSVAKVSMILWFVIITFQVASIQSKK